MCARARAALVRAGESTSPAELAMTCTCMCVRVGVERGGIHTSIQAYKHMRAQALKCCGHEPRIPVAICLFYLDIGLFYLDRSLLLSYRSFYLDRFSLFT